MGISIAVVDTISVFEKHIDEVTDKDVDKARDHLEYIVANYNAICRARCLDRKAIQVVTSVEARAQQEKMDRLGDLEKSIKTVGFYFRGGV